MYLCTSVVSLGLGLNNEDYDMLGNVLLVSGVMLNMRSFLYCFS